MISDITDATNYTEASALVEAMIDEVYQDANSGSEEEIVGRDDVAWEIIKSQASELLRCQDENQRFIGRELLRCELGWDEHEIARAVQCIKTRGYIPS